MAKRTIETIPVSLPDGSTEYFPSPEMCQALKEGYDLAGKIQETPFAFLVAAGILSATTSWFIRWTKEQDRKDIQRQKGRGRIQKKRQELRQKNRR